MIDFLLILIIPVLIALASLLLFKGKVTIGEFSLQIIAPAIVAACLIAGFTYSTVSATELWNSQINRRDRTQVSCSHSYSCNCHTTTSGSGKNRHTSEHCDTCYEHAYDVDWTVGTSSGERMEIERVDRQGIQMPRRWSQAYVGEPFSSEHAYDNYLLVNKDSVLFGGKGDTQRFASLIPKYPRVFDYYHLDHVMVTGGLSIDTKTWNWLLNEANKTLGTSKQANVLVVIAKTSDPAYTIALKSAWLGAQKNDLVVVIGTLDGHKIEFADVVSWTPREDLKVELRDRIVSIGTLDQRDAIVQAISSMTSAKFERLHMKKYKYLLTSIELTTGQMIFGFVLCLLLEIGITYWVVQNDITLNPQTGRRNYSRQWS